MITKIKVILGEERGIKAWDKNGTSKYFSYKFLIKK
jgi:hypothetical protein